MATVTGTIKDLFETTFVSGKITFTKLGRLSVDGSSLVFPGKREVVTDASGAFSVSLAPGNYRVTIEDAWGLITVPSTGSSFAIIDLLSPDTTQSNVNYIPITPTGGNLRLKDGKWFQIQNNTTGLWHTLQIDGASGQAYVALGGGEA